MLPQLEQQTAEQIADADALAREDLGWFAEHCFGYVNADHHEEWYGLLQNRAVQANPADPTSRIIFLSKPVARNKHLLIEAPRDHGKSTVFSVVYPAWRIGKEPNVRIVLASNAQGTSEMFLREVSTIMERHANYRRIFGNLKPSQPEKWTDTEIIVSRTSTSKDATLVATSIGGQVIAKRADVIICDDILTLLNTRTQVQRDHVREWFFTVLLPVLVPGGMLIVAGTAWNIEDLYQVLMADSTFQVRKRYDAIVDAKRKLTLWPARWSWQGLMERKASMGSRSFNRSYRNIVSAPENTPFQEAGIRGALERGRNRRLLTELHYPTWDLGPLTTTLGIDLAISQKRNSDYTAGAVIGRTNQGMKIPLYLFRRRLTPAQTRAMIKQLNDAFDLSLIVVESNAYQASLQMDMADETDLPIEGYTTGGEKFDEAVGINSLAVEVENNKWILPYDSADPYTVEMVDHLVAGMRSFDPTGGGHTEDLLMALWLANGGMRRLMAKKRKRTATWGRGRVFNRGK